MNKVRLTNKGSWPLLGTVGFLGPRNHTAETPGIRLLVLCCLRLLGFHCAAQASLELLILLLQILPTVYHGGQISGPCIRFLFSTLTLAFLPEVNLHYLQEHILLVHP